MLFMGFLLLTKTFYCMYLNTQETDVQKLQDKLNSGQIEEVIVQVKRGNLRLSTNVEVFFSVPLAELLYRKLAVLCIFLCCKTNSQTEEKPLKTNFPDVIGMAMLKLNKLTTVSCIMLTDMHVYLHCFLQSLNW